jgi:hypothetical protein
VSYRTTYPTLPYTIPGEKLYYSCFWDKFPEKVLKEFYVISQFIFSFLVKVGEEEEGKVFL